MEAKTMHVLIIEPAFSCLRLLPLAQQYGLHVTVFTANTVNRYVPTPYYQYINQMITVDTNNLDEVMKQAKFLHRNHLIDGIIPGSEYAVVIAAKLAAYFGLPGHDVTTIQAFRNKADMREMLEDSGIRIPNYYVISSAEKLEEAARTTLFPAVIKPTSMAGSLNVFKVKNLDELREVYSTIKNSTLEEMGHSSRNGIILEEYISGKEYSVEGYISNSDGKPKVQILSITEKFLTPEPTFVEIGHIVKANIDPTIAKQISTYIDALAQKLNVTMGVMHWEIKVDDNGPVLIEGAVRPGGCNITTLLQLTTSIDLVEVMLLSHLGLPLEPALQGSPSYKVAGIQFFMMDNHHNCYATLTGESKLQQLASYVDYQVTALPYKQIAHPETFEGRIAYVIFAGLTYEEVLTAMQAAQRCMQITYPNPAPQQDVRNSAKSSRLRVKR